MEARKLWSTETFSVFNHYKKTAGIELYGIERGVNY